MNSLLLPTTLSGALTRLQTHLGHYIPDFRSDAILKKLRMPGNSMRESIILTDSLGLFRLTRL